MSKTQIAEPGDMILFGKVYHYTWSSKARLNKIRKLFPQNAMVLHRGDRDKCRRVHYDQRGNKLLGGKL